MYVFAHLAIICRPDLCRVRVVERSLVMLGRCTGSHWASSRGASEVRFLFRVPSALLHLPWTHAHSTMDLPFEMTVLCPKRGHGTSSDDVTEPIMQASTLLTCHGALLSCNKPFLNEAGRQRVRKISSQLAVASNMHAG